MRTNFYYKYGKLNEKKEPITARQSAVIPENWPTVGGWFKEEYMMVDTDTPQDSDLLFQLIQDFNLKTHVLATDGGLHAIFKAPSDFKLRNANKVESLIGIIADYKLGPKGSYECIIKHGKPREVIIDCEEPQELPWFLYQWSKPRELQQVEHGDCRHGILGGLVSVYAMYEKSDELIKKSIEWVNDNVFKEPRERVNWSLKDIQSAIEFRKDDKITKEQVFELSDKYEINWFDIFRYIKTNCKEKWLC